MSYKKKEEREEKEPREFVPSKRIKNLHRQSGESLSLKAFARKLMKIERESELLEAWQLNKGIVL